MADSFLTFQTFSDLELAEEMAAQLQEKGIECTVENNRQFFDPSYANNSFGADISLKLKPADFYKARKTLEDYYEKHVDQVGRDYYLFDFTDQELVEVVAKPDEWGFLDYQLAQKILKERGKEINPDVAALLKTQRDKDLAQPESAHRYWIYAGYISAILGGLIGVIIAWTLAYFKKTLPNGQRVYVYKEEDRNHGTRILLISCVSLVFWLLVRWWFVEE